MRSELIQEIFTIEKKAELIVKEAKETCRQRLATIHTEGENLVREASQQARDNRFTLLEKAQVESSERVEALHASLQNNEIDSDTQQLLIDKTVDDLIAKLCSSTCTEVRGQ
jgi:vacuolar-type H+-ATPase subunit H